MLAAAMLAEVNALPTPECESAIDHGNRQRHIGHHRSHMCGHVVRPFGRVCPAGIIFANGSSKPRFEVTSRRRIRVFLNGQTCRGVLHEQDTQAVSDIGSGHNPRNIAGNLVQPLPGGLDHQHDAHSTTAHAEFSMSLTHILPGVLEKFLHFCSLSCPSGAVLTHRLTFLRSAAGQTEASQNQDEQHYPHDTDHPLTAEQGQVAGLPGSSATVDGTCPSGPRAPALIQSTIV